MPINYTQSGSQFCIHYEDSNAPGEPQVIGMFGSHAEAMNWLERFGSAHVTVCEIFWSRLVLRVTHPTGAVATFTIVPVISIPQFLETWNV